MMSSDFSATIPVLIVAFCVLSLTILFPLVASIWKLLFRTQGSARANAVPFTGFSVVIPVHNEELLLAETLESIFRAKRLFTQAHPDKNVEILIGLDSCTDKSETVAAGYAAKIFKFENRSKFLTLFDLGPHLQYSHTLLLDAGTRLSPEFLKEGLKIFTNNQLLGFNLSYRSKSVSSLEQFSWFLETRLKNLENFCGGPISSHGACVAYRTQEFQHALRNLGRNPWFNDDIVIPLTLRKSHPNQTFQYIAQHSPEFSYTDAGISRKIQYQRRQRMVVGNIQWIKYVFAPLAFKDLTTTLLCCRRIVRVFWAYLFIVSAVSTGIFASLFIGEWLAATLVGISLGILLKKLRDAFWASFKAPYFLLKTQKQLENYSWN